MDGIIIKPIITEKSLKEADFGKYSFVVAKDAHKPEIKSAVESLFGVTVLSVATATIKGSKTRMTRYGRKKSDDTYKKARVELAKGQKIQLLEEGEKKEKKK